MSDNSLYCANFRIEGDDCVMDCKRRNSEFKTVIRRKDYVAYDRRVNPKQPISSRVKRMWGLGAYVLRILERRYPVDGTLRLTAADLA
jgi:hypothetical protein